MTILCAIANEGTGKGVLSTIMEQLHSPTNFVKVRDTVFKNRFNSHLQNKTLVYVDEASIKNKEALDRLKDCINLRTEFEAKGVDAVNSTNWASYYLSSNSFDAIRFGADDRRFSILDMTDIPLKATPIINRIDELTSHENIQNLGWFLLNRKVTRDMLTPFKAARAEEVKEAGLTDWEYWLVFTWATNQIPGSQIDYKTVQQAVLAEFPVMRIIGRRKIQKVVQQYPGVFTWHQKAGTAYRYVQIT